jgi:class 3 adenylate cyclase/tetratricopeptide (TPR) repeat protein
VICAACGTANAAGRRFCLECGGPLAAACPSCGASNEAGAKFCGNCGGRIAAGGPPARGGPADTELAARDDGARAGSGAIAERRLVSVLFADLVGFTALAADRDPEATRELLGRYFDTAREVIARYGGIVEKFIGDAVMAVWGAPTAHEDDAERAVRAALELVGAVRDLSDPAAGVELQLRAGVLTGEAAVTLGAQGQGMVAGDLVNTASRLQSVAPPGSVLVGDSTRRAVGPAIHFEAAGDQVLKGKPAPVPAFRAVRVVGERRGGPQELVEPPFVGRDDELRLLKDSFNATGRDGRARLLSIVGQAGIGKTRLAWELEKYLDGVVESVYWHAGRSAAYGAGSAFGALAEMIRRRARLGDDDDAAVTRRRIGELCSEWLPDPAERARVEPRLLALLGVGDAPPGGREELFAAWRTVFERIAARGTTMLVFEDLHWGDDGLLDFIDHVLDWSRQHPLLVVTLARPELLDRRPGWGTDRPNATAVRLEPLSDHAMRALLDGLVPGLPLAAVDAILDRAGGVPLYAVEIVRMLLGDGALAEVDGIFQPTRDLSDLRPPESLLALVGARLDGLEPADRALVQDASVLAGRFSVAALAAVSGQDPAELESRMRGLVRREVFALETDLRSPDRGRYGFVQALLRDVAYSTLARRDRRVRHLAAARHFEGLGEEHASSLAEQYLAAYRAAPEGPEGEAAGAQARLALRAAADRAIDVGALEQGVVHLRAVAEIATSDAEAAAALVRAGETLVYAGGATDSMPLLREAITRLERTGDRAAVIGASGSLGSVYLTAAEIGAAVELLEPLVAEAEALPPGPHAARFAEAWSRALFRSARPAESLPWCDRAITLCEDAGLDLLCGHALVTRSSVLLNLGRRSEGWALLGGTRLLMQQEGLHWVALRASSNMASFSGDEDPRGAFEICRAGMDEVVRLGLLGYATYLMGNGLGTGETLGEWDWLEGTARQLLEISRDPGARQWFEWIAATIATYRGEDHHDVLEAMWRTGEAAADPQTLGNAASSLARAAYVRADFADGLSWIERGRIAWGGTWGAAEIGFEARLALLTGNAKRVEEMRTTLVAMRGRRAVLAELAMVEAAAAALAGRRDEAISGYRGALDRCRDHGMRYSLALTVLEVAAVLGPDAALDLGAADEARATLVELRSAPLLERFDALLGAAIGAHGSQAR